MAEITHNSVNEVATGPQDVRITRLGKALVAATMTGAVLFGGSVLHETSQPSDEQEQTHRIIEDPKNIPAGEAMTIPASDGIGANEIARQYASRGHVNDLQHELTQEYPDGLPTGQVTVYKGFVQEPIVQRYEEEISAAR